MKRLLASLPRYWGYCGCGLQVPNPENTGMAVANRRHARTTKLVPSLPAHWRCEFLSCCILVGLLASGIGLAVEEAGRWAGHWLVENQAADVAERVEQDEVELVEGGVPEFGDVSAFEVAPAQLLVDVAEVLSPGAAADRLEFLRHHADDSKIALHVYLFGEGVELPAETGVGRFFKNANTAVVFYFMGEPQRAGLYFPRPLADAISDAEQRRSLQSAIMQAAGKAEPEEQFESFLTQMSIRLYWMERMLDDGFVEVELANVVLPENPAAKRLRMPEIQFPSEGLWWIGSGMFLLLMLPVVWWVRKVRARYRFPEFPAEPRLGGRHAAGVGAVISYLSANIPPAAQREQGAEFSGES